MRSLPQVLHEAAEHEASEIVLEPGRAPLMRTGAGSVPVGEVFEESDLFDALTQVLAPEQQAELAVGNVVEFHIEGHSGRWTLISEPSADGIVVRGRRLAADDGEEVGVPLHLPPLEHSESEADDVVRAPSSVFKRASSRQTAWDLVAQPAPAQERGSPPPRGADAPQTDGRSVPLPESSDETPDWLERGSSGETQETPPVPYAGGVELPDAASIDFELRESGEEGSPMEQPVEDASIAGASADSVPQEGIELPDVPDDSGAFYSGTPDTSDDTSASPATELTDGDPFAEYGRSLAWGTLCLVRGTVGLELGRAADDNVVVLDESGRDEIVASALQRDPQTTYVVRLEDPSVCLGWILRRLEEGARIIVETRARTPDGARRTLLGIAAGSRAEQWIDAVSLCWLAEENGRWTMSS